MRDTSSTSTTRPKKRQRLRPSNSSLVNLLVLCTSLQITSVPSIVQATPSNKSCNTVADTCPTKFDGVCDRSANSACASGDCYDCDECPQYNADCASCLANGCYYCPGDATCFNSPNYIMTNVFSHCSKPSDYLKDTCQQASNYFQDPLYSAEAWVYQMVRVEEVWKQGISGAGIRVRVNDNGVDSTHMEFQGRFDIEGSCDRYDPQELDTETGFHGTVVAGIIGGAANNGKCSVGIAPNVTLSSCYVFDSSDFLSVKMDSYDISQNSYGINGCQQQVSVRQLQGGSCPFQYNDPATISPCDICTNWDSPSQQCEIAIKQHCQLNYEYDVDGCLDFLDLILGGNCIYSVLNSWERDAVVQGITLGRNGKGIVYLFASGNSYAEGDDTNFQAYTNSRFFITVGGVGKDRKHASYSTPGASLFVVGPGGDFENVANHVTAGPGNTCIEAGSGTSFATPVVTGVVALMLEANPDLTWRDVQHIIAETSQQVTDSYDDSTTVNAAGFWHSNLYGFGIVDAAAAVKKAQSWILVGPEKMVMAESGNLSLPILDDASVVLTTTLRIPSPSPTFNVESVLVQLDLEYFTRGNLEITLTSPQGTQSILSPGKRPENTQLAASDRWKLLTVRNWGENPDGNWTLSIVDTKAGDAGNCANEPWSMSVGLQELDCNVIDQVGLCVDGQLDPYRQLSQPLFDQIFGYQDNGVKASDACCSCGGGLTKVQVRSQLRQWTLVVYGHDDSDVSDGTPTEPPSIAPTNLATTARPLSPPSEVPTPQPSPRPTYKPSQPPTKKPTVTPTVAPTLPPTMPPTLPPTMPPTMPPTVLQTSQQGSKVPTPETNPPSAPANNRPVPTAPPSPIPTDKATALQSPTNEPTRRDPPTGSGRPVATAPPSAMPTDSTTTTVPVQGTDPPSGSGRPVPTAPPSPIPTDSTATTAPLKTNATAVPTPLATNLTVVPTTSPSNVPTENPDGVSLTDLTNNLTNSTAVPTAEESSLFPSTAPTLVSAAPSENATTFPSNTTDATLDPSTSPNSSMSSTSAPSLRPSPPSRPNQPETPAFGSQTAPALKSASNRVESFTIALFTTLVSSTVIIISSR